MRTRKHLAMFAVPVVMAGAASLLLGTLVSTLGPPADTALCPPGPLAGAVTAPTGAAAIRTTPHGAPAGAAPVAGIVVDQDGEAVPGALVSYAMADGSRSDVITADPDGRWRVEQLGAGTLVVHATSPTHASAADATVALDGQHAMTNVTVRVELGATISGVVVDSRGRPVPGAEVTCTGGSAAIDAHGHFEVTGIAPGEVHLFATTSTLGSPPLQLQIAKGSHLGARLVMTETRITGRVKNERGEPVPGAWVRAHATTPDGTTVECVSGGDGAFEVHGVPAGTYELIAGRDDNGHESPRPVTVHTGSRRVALVLP